jgi:hypothetical protein
MNEARKESDSRYKLLHKKEINEAARLRYHTNSDKRLQHQLEKVSCKVCNEMITRNNLKRHNNTKKHQERVEFKIELTKLCKEYDRRYKEYLEKCITFIQELVNKNGRVTSWTPERVLDRLRQAIIDINDVYTNTIIKCRDKELISRKLVLDWESFMHYVNKDIVI